MEDFHLRAISSVAPTIDLTAGIVIMLMTALVAHAVFIPKLYSHSPRLAITFLAVSLLGLLSVVASLAAYPAKIYLASLIYVAVFAFVGCLASRRSSYKFQLRRRAVAASTFMLFGVGFAWWLAFAPR